jgi:hypothetical protein
MDRRLGEPQGQSGRLGEEKNSYSHRNSNSDPLVAQPVARGYTDCAIPARGVENKEFKQLAEKKQATENAQQDAELFSNMAVTYSRKTI